MTLIFSQNTFFQEKSIFQYIEPIWLGIRIYRCFILNLLGVKTPFFIGHKLTYNCNLRCKMCPFWKRTSADSTLAQEKAILKQIYNSGACGVAFEGGEPLLRRDLVDILAFSRSLPLHTSLITNGTLLEGRIDEIAPYINGVIYVSLDGLEKTHDKIRGINGSFRRTLAGINAAKRKCSVTINTTMMAENVDEIESLVKLAKELGTKISLATAHEYCSTDVSLAVIDRIPKIAYRLIEMKRKGYPIANSSGYLKVMAKIKDWRCRPWTMVNVDANGNIVLPCYVKNDYASSVHISKGGIKGAISSFDWKNVDDCKKCSLHCYVEPSLALSRDINAYMYWAFRVNL
jgi:MoaA/NifB/PqqE/SkfB family radical SAM enzyme